MAKEVLTESEQCIVPIAEYESPSSRIKGFQQIEELGLTHPSPMLILTHEAFVRYKNEGSLPQPIEDAIRQAYRKIRETNPTRGAYIGRAFYVPGIDNPHGPRTAAIYDEDQYVVEVVKFYEFVTANRYHDQPEANIALILHPFINVADQRTFYGNRLLRESEQLPWSGGYAVLRPTPGSPECVEITATFGPDEAVQSVPSDRFRVDPIEGIVLSKDIARKDITLVPREGTEYRLTPVPTAFQDKQSLTDEELIRVAREAWKVFQRYTDTRVEFILQTDGVYVREIAPRGTIEIDRLFKFKEAEEMVGWVVVVQSLQDLGRLTGREAIVYLHPDAFRERTTDVFAHLVGLGLQRLVAISYGWSTTSHPTKVISEAGYSVIPWGPHLLKDGQRLRILRNPDGTPHVEYLDPYENAVVSLGETALLLEGLDGQKVARIARMRQAGITTPDGWVIRSEALWRWLEDSGIAEHIRLLQTIGKDDNGALDDRIRHLQLTIRSTPFPDALRQKLDVLGQIRDSSSWIVRSTGPEDINGHSHAGLYVSTPNVAPDAVENAVRETIASYFSRASVEALKHAGLDVLRIPVAVLVQEYVQPRENLLGGVVFTHEKDMTIELAVGSPEPIVSHRAMDYVRVTIPRGGKSTIEIIGHPRIDISSDVVDAIVATAERIEGLFRSYQDIELIVTPEETIIVFQARPL